MPIMTVCSSKNTAREAVEEICNGIRKGHPRLVVYFASARYDLAQLSTEMKAAFSDAVLIGCSTAGEIVSGRMLKGSVVAMGIGSDVVEDEAIVFYCNIKEGMEISLLESTDIVNDTRKAVQDKAVTPGSMAGMINFNCILRTLELEQKGQTEDYGRIFSSIPTIGFSTYGEQYIGHINQTSTILVFR